MARVTKPLIKPKLLFQYNCDFVLQTSYPSRFAMLSAARPGQNFNIVTISGSIWRSKIARRVYDMSTTLGRARYAAQEYGFLASSIF